MLLRRYVDELAVYSFLSLSFIFFLNSFSALICALIPLLMSRFATIFPDKIFSYEVLIIFSCHYKLELLLRTDISKHMQLCLLAYVELTFTI